MWCVRIRPPQPTRRAATRTVATDRRPRAPSPHIWHRHTVGKTQYASVVSVSAASAWEVAIKTAAGKIRIGAPFGDGVEESGFVPLPVNFVHAAAAGELPPHHRDPFDRMLVAQARVERLTLISGDRQLEPYDVAMIWA